jgi:hypothetical protein
MTLQARDDMLRSKDERRFNLRRKRMECKKLVVDGTPITDDDGPAGESTLQPWHRVRPLSPNQVMLRVKWHKLKLCLMGLRTFSLTLP